MVCADDQPARIEVRLVRSSERPAQSARGARDPYGGLTPAEHRARAIEVLGAVWAAVCIRKAKEGAGTMRDEND